MKYKFPTKIKQRRVSKKVVGYILTVPKKIGDSLDSSKVYSISIECAGDSLD